MQPRSGVEPTHARADNFTYVAVANPVRPCEGATVRVTRAEDYVTACIMCTKD
jgi:hypothetical protein